MTINAVFVEPLKPSDDQQKFLWCAGSMPEGTRTCRVKASQARTFTTQIEALKRYRSTGEQKMTVQHVTVNDGGQAVIGQVGGGWYK